MSLSTEIKLDNATLQSDQFQFQVAHISRQSGAFFAGTIFTAAFGYVFKVYLARVLGAEDLGIYTLGLTLIGFVGIFNTLGLAQSAVRFVAAYLAASKFVQLHAILWRGTAILVGTNLFFAILLLTLGGGVALRFYHSPALLRYLPWFALIMLFGVLSFFFSKVLAGYRDLARRTVIVNFVGSPLVMVIAVILIASGMGLRGYLMAQAVSGGIICVLLIALVRKHTPEKSRLFAQPGVPLEPEVWSFSAAMLGVGLLEFLIVHADKVALGYYRGAREVGVYSVAAAVVAYVPLALQSVNQIFAPTIADLYTRGEHVLLSRLFKSLTKWVTALTLPLAAVVVVFSRPLMRIFGADFEAGWPILVIGTLGQLVNCGVGSVGYLLLMSGNERRLIKVQASMAAVMVVLNIALVPIWGITGAAVAAAITNVGMNVWNLLQVRAALHLSPYNRSYLYLVPPSLATLAVTLLLRNYSGFLHSDWLVMAMSLVIAYVTFAGMVFVFGLNSDDRLIVDAIWMRLQRALGKNEEGLAA